MSRSLTIPFGAGSEPAVIDIDDSREAIGIKPETDDLGYTVEFCDLTFCGYCEYSMADKFRRCIHCGRESGL